MKKKQRITKQLVNIIITEIKFLAETTSTVRRTGYQGFDDLKTTIL